MAEGIESNCGCDEVELEGWEPLGCARGAAVVAEEEDAMLRERECWPKVCYDGEGRGWTGKKEPSRPSLRSAQEAEQAAFAFVSRSHTSGLRPGKLHCRGPVERRALSKSLSLALQSKSLSLALPGSETEACTPRITKVIDPE